MRMQVKTIALQIISSCVFVYACDISAQYTVSLYVCTGVIQYMWGHVSISHFDTFPS